jgi:DNA modification methylase
MIKKVNGVPIRCTFTRLAKTSELKGNPRNPNFHGEAQLDLYRKILEHQGWRKAITVSKQSGFVVTGHGALEVAKRAGWPQVPVDEQDFATPQDELSHLLADNKLPQMAELDLGMTKLVLQDLRMDKAFDLSLTGFDAEEMLKVHNWPGVKDPRVGKADELQKLWKTKRGQVWKMKGHRLLIGDALDPESWKRLEGPFNLVFADPPYELSLSVGSFRAGAKRDVLMMQRDDHMMEQDAKHFRHFYVYTFDPHGMRLPQWRSMSWYAHVLIGWWRFVPHDSDFKGLLTHMHLDDWRTDAEQGQKHAKPIKVYEWLLPYFVKKGEPFGEAFAGAGTGLMYAEQSGTKWRGVELSPAYVAVILDRFERSFGVKGELETQTQAPSNTAPKGS